MSNNRFFLFAPAAFLWLLSACHSSPAPTDPIDPNEPEKGSVQVDSIPNPISCAHQIGVNQPLRVGRWYRFLDSLVLAYDTLLPYPLKTEHILHANPWLLDTLVNSDYDIQMARDSFIGDNRLWIVVRPGQELCIPDSNAAAEIDRKLASTWLDINIPEFKLRIVQGSDTLHTCKIRVGQVRIRHLELAGREVDLRTHTGEGKIVRVETDPLFLNPVTGEKFTTTRRDDGKRTEMPLIPWIEPEINGQRYGQLIHPTTNPVTLGKAYSNGCIGASEADAWRVYYHAPVGTKVKIRYELDVVQPSGDTLHFKDIYHMKGRKSLPKLPSRAIIIRPDTIRKDS
jgi:L,D-transpeptidase ErfK/SrfK